MKKNKFTYGLMTTLVVFLKKYESNHFPFYKFIWNASHELSEEESLDFYEGSKKICEIEALTFKTDENLWHLIQAKNQIHNLELKVSHLLEKFGIQWNASRNRLWIGFFCCFMEWCEETGYFCLTKKDQALIWSENPLNSLQLY